MSAESAIITIESQRELAEKSQVNSAKNMISHLESHTDIDQFQQYKDNFVSGFSVTDWSSGKSKYTMKCSSSWEALEFVSKSGKLKKSLFLNMLRSVTLGRRPGGHSTLIGKARSDCAFYLECTNTNKTKKKSGNIMYVDLEASSSSACSTIVQALRLLHRIFKVNPNQLKNPDHDGSRS